MLTQKRKKRTMIASMMRQAAHWKAARRRRRMRLLQQLASSVQLSKEKNLLLLLWPSESFADAAKASAARSAIADCRRTAASADSGSSSKENRDFLPPWHLPWLCEPTRPRGELF